MTCRSHVEAVGVHGIEPCLIHFSGDADDVFLFQCLERSDHMPLA
jgi:hypothetical protein